mmetsp:Transcript_45407/g.91615  ORF Transcript_45407/g.91615 Transcript_45407/m.91615 type:complete len:269 (+) Transcript_45407:90-896(+)
MSSLKLPSSIGSEIARAASLRASRQAEQQAEEVTWDLNLKSAEQRLAPYSFVFSDIPDSVLVIEQRNEQRNEPGSPASGTGSALWSAAIGLARFIEFRYGHLAGPGLNCIELGCGTGMVSLVSAVMGMTVVATDIPECLANDTVPNVEANAAVLEGREGTVETRPLVWGTTPLEHFGSEWDLVVASDVIYRAEHVPLLLETLKGVMGPATTAYVAFDRRGREGVEAFLRSIKAENSSFAVRDVGSDEMPAGYRFVHFGLVELRVAQDK